MKLKLLMRLHAGLNVDQEMSRLYQDSASLSATLRDVENVEGI